MSNQSMAHLINKLQAPLIVSDILTGRDQEDDTIYALSTLISDMQPDAAILAIALSMRAIIAPYLFASPSLQMTEIECTRLIEDYSQSWINAPLGANTAPTTAIDILEDAIDDLVYMQELLELNTNFLSAKDIVGADLCRLLSQQVAAQKSIAEHYIKVLSDIDNENTKQHLLKTAEIVDFPVS